MDKNKEILFKQKKQNELKLEVQQMKNKLPKYIVGFIFFVAVSLYFLEDNFFHFFGNGVNFVMSAVVLLCSFLFLFLLKSYITINKKQKESKDLGIQLYNLMKLEENTVDE
ncbi:hypothetical protein [Polaribacter sp. L3A8]|uniref:hypothetical protein n=1 Tax=Polaribacter sp. L3A8 TaxID=2686361 RepID=UPI00131BBADD|nr:hypothetical protein [Polaribacter sp. L3A8]